MHDNNEAAIAAISEKLSEVTILAERLDTTLCGFKFAMESDCIKKLLENAGSSYEVRNFSLLPNFVEFVDRSARIPIA